MKAPGQKRSKSVGPFVLNHEVGIRPESAATPGELIVDPRFPNTVAEVPRFEHPSRVDDVVAGRSSSRAGRKRREKLRVFTEKRGPWSDAPNHPRARNDGSPYHFSRTAR